MRKVRHDQAVRSRAGVVGCGGCGQPKGAEHAANCCNEAAYRRFRDEVLATFGPMDDAAVSALLRRMGLQS